MTSELDSSTSVGNLFLHHHDFPQHDSELSENAYSEIGQLFWLTVQCSEALRLLPNDVIEFGRSSAERIWHACHRDISKHHLRFRCVVYDKEATELDEVKPMVYVRVLSPKPLQLTSSQLPASHSHIRLSGSDGDFLLAEGDILQVNPFISITFRDLGSAVPDLDRNQVVNQSQVQNLDGIYLVTRRVLGIGGQARVVLAWNQLTKRQVACKITASSTTLDKHGLTSNKSVAQNRSTGKVTDVAQEYEILKNLSHPNIIHVEATMRIDGSLYIFLELVTGGDLISYIERQGKLNEAQTIVVVRQVLEAIVYLHENGFVHRDIKLENILLTSWDVGARVVLADFGQARHVHKGLNLHTETEIKRMHTAVGTAGYYAPEIAPWTTSHRGYTRAIDMWAIGCVTASLLTDTMMFPDQQDMMNAALTGSKKVPSSQCEFDFSKLECASLWQGISRNARSFVRGCLRPDENDRLTAKAGLMHTWFTNEKYVEEANEAYRRAIADWPFRCYHRPDLSNHNFVVSD